MGAGAGSGSLNITTQVDVSQISKIDEATARVRAAYDQQAQAALALKDAQLQVNSIMEAYVAQTMPAAAATQELSVSMALKAQAEQEGRAASAQLKAATTDLTAALEEQAVAATQVTTADTLLNAANQELAASDSVVQGHMTEGFYKASLFRQELGIRLPRAIEMLIARTPVLADLLNAAFPIVAVYAFAQILDTVGEKIAKLISDTFIYTQAMQDEYAAQVKLNGEFVKSEEQLKKLTDAYELIGVKGAERYNVILGQQSEAMDKLQASERDLTNAIYLQQQGLFDSGQTMTELHRKLGEIQEQEKVLSQQIQNTVKEHDTTKAQEDERAYQKELEKSRQLAQRLESAYESRNRAAESAAKKAKDTEEQLAEAQSAATAAFNKAMEERDKKSAKQNIAINMQVDTGAEQHAKELEAYKEESIRVQEQIGAITNAQALAQLKSLHQAELAEDLKFIDDKIALAKLDPDHPEKVQELMNQRQAIIDKAHLQALKDDSANLALRQQQYTQFFDRIGRGFDTVVTGWLQRTETFSQALTRGFDSMIVAEAKAVEKMVQKWIVGELTKTAAHAAGVEAQVTATAAGEQQKATIEGISKLKTITTAAEKAAAKAFSAFADIPLIGPALGAAAAATTFVAVEAFGMMGGYAQGGIVPQDQIALVHQNEMVLPPAISKGMQQMIAGGGAKGGAHSFSYTANLQAVNDQQFKALLDRHGEIVAGIVMAKLRQRNLL